jgi:hypothetical protein
MRNASYTQAAPNEAADKRESRAMLGSRRRNVSAA